MEGDIPADFLVREIGARRVYVAREHAEALEELGFVDGHPAGRPVATLSGRARHPVYLLPRTEERVLWKRCGRGGFMEPVLRDRYLRVERFFEELRLIAAARSAGISVAETLGLAVSELRSGWRRVEMVHRIVEGAQDLGAALESKAFDGRDRRALLRAVAALLRRFHGHGFLHGDLNVRNILWRSNSARGFEVTLIDLDPTLGLLAAPRATPQRNLLRLFRSYYKGERTGRWRLPIADLCVFVDEYFRSDRAARRQFWRLASRRRQRWEWLPMRRERERSSRGRRAASHPAGLDS